MDEKLNNNTQFKTTDNLMEAWLAKQTSQDVLARHINEQLERKETKILQERASIIKEIKDEMSNIGIFEASVKITYEENIEFLRQKGYAVEGDGGKDGDGFGRDFIYCVSWVNAVKPPTTGE